MCLNSENYRSYTIYFLLARVLHMSTRQMRLENLDINGENLFSMVVMPISRSISFRFLQNVTKEKNISFNKMTGARRLLFRWYYK